MAKIPEILASFQQNLVDLTAALQPLVDLAADFAPAESTRVTIGLVTTAEAKELSAMVESAGGTVTLRPARRGRPRKPVSLLGIAADAPSPSEPVAGPVLPEEPVDVIMAPPAAPRVVSPARAFQGRWMAATRKLGETDKAEAKRLRTIDADAALIWAQGRSVEVSF